LGVISCAITPDYYVARSSLECDSGPNFVADDGQSVEVMHSMTFNWHWSRKRTALS
jgi:hypothetical protein